MSDLSRFASLIGFLDICNEQLPAAERLSVVGSAHGCAWITSAQRAWVVAPEPKEAFQFWTCFQVDAPFSMRAVGTSAEQVSPEAAFVALVEIEGWRDADGNPAMLPWDPARTSVDPADHFNPTGAPPPFILTVHSELSEKDVNAFVDQLRAADPGTIATRVSE